MAYFAIGDTVKHESKEYKVVIGQCIKCAMYNKNCTKLLNKYHSVQGFGKCDNVLGSGILKEVIEEVW